MSLLLLFFCVVFTGCEERIVIVPEKKSATSSDFFTEQKTPSAVLPFEEKEWKTSPLDPNPEGSRACPGGSISMAVSEYPPTFRIFGKDTHLQILSLMEGLVYESLLGMNPRTLEYEPNLASRWWISPDGKEYYFRMDPKAKWSDGKPVTAMDVEATFTLMTDSEIQDPALSQMYTENFEKPEVLSPEVFRVKCKKPGWRTFMLFIGFSILPAHHCRKVDGVSFLEKYQYRMMPGSGPYRLDLRQTLKGVRIVLKRRKDYWGDSRVQGVYNFDEIRFVVVSDDRLELEKFKKGEFDLYIPARAQWWHQELVASKVDSIQRGLIQRRKIFNYNPQGFSGIAFNTQQPPFDDLRVREAFMLLWNVDQLIEKMFFGEYDRCRSYFQGTVYENPSLQNPKYNPQKALELLAEAGWVKKEGKPWLMKDGKILEVDMTLDSALNRIFTPYQEDLKKAGIKLNLSNMTQQAIFEAVMKREFTMTYTGWTGQLFPNPESSMHSKYADLAESGNITGMRNPEIDRICDEYEQTFDITKRIEQLKALDALAVGQTHYAFGWVAPYAARVAFWNKFGYPEEGLSYSGDWRSIFYLWWVDPEKEGELKKARKDKTRIMPQGTEIIDFWKKIKSSQAVENEQ